MFPAKYRTNILVRIVRMGGSANPALVWRTVVKTLLSLAAVAALSIAAASPASAHHSANAQFDTSKELSVTGTLMQMDDINPHSRWLAVVKGPDGQAENWTFESVSPSALRRSGVKVKEEIKSGNTYTFFYAPSWDGSKSGLLTAMTIDGRKVTYVKV